MVERAKDGWLPTSAAPTKHIGGDARRGAGERRSGRRGETRRAAERHHHMAPRLQMCLRASARAQGGGGDGWRRRRLEEEMGEGRDGFSSGGRGVCLSPWRRRRRTEETRCRRALTRRRGALAVIRPVTRGRPRSPSSSERMRMKRLLFWSRRARGFLSQPTNQQPASESASRPGQVDLKEQLYLKTCARLCVCACVCTRLGQCVCVCARACAWLRVFVFNRSL